MTLDADESDDKDEVSFDMPDCCTRTPRLLLTPTRLAVVGFSVEMSNRVVRHFLSREGFEPGSFLRVSIGEENGSRLFSGQLTPEVCARIKSLVLQGLTLNGREYRFLAYSSSQLKESSLWMVDASGAWDVASIRKWMVRSQHV
jgi:RNA-dependent RNA polymerase